MFVGDGLWCDPSAPEPMVQPAVAPVNITVMFVVPATESAAVSFPEARRTGAFGGDFPKDMQTQRMAQPHDGAVGATAVVGSHREVPAL